MPARQSQTTMRRLSGGWPWCRRLVCLPVHLLPLPSLPISCLTEEENIHTASPARMALEPCDSLDVACRRTDE